MTKSIELPDIWRPNTESLDARREKNGGATKRSVNLRYGSNVIQAQSRAAASVSVPARICSRTGLPLSQPDAPTVIDRTALAASPAN